MCLNQFQYNLHDFWQSGWLRAEWQSHTWIWQLRERRNQSDSPLYPPSDVCTGWPPHLLRKNVSLSKCLHSVPSTTVNFANFLHSIPYLMLSLISCLPVLFVCVFNNRLSTSHVQVKWGSVTGRSTCWSRVSSIDSRYHEAPAGENTVLTFHQQKNNPILSSKCKSTTLPLSATTASQYSRTTFKNKKKTS